MATANPDIVKKVEGYYRDNVKGRNIFRPTRGQSWARALIALGYDVSKLEPKDRNLDPLTSAEAWKKKWVGWRPVYHEIKRLEDKQNGLDVSVNTEHDVLADISVSGTVVGEARDTPPAIPKRVESVSGYATVVDPRNGLSTSVPGKYMRQIRGFSYRVSECNPTGRDLGLYMTVEYGKRSSGLSLLGVVDPTTLKGEYEPEALPPVHNKKCPTPKITNFRVDGRKIVYDFVDYPFAVGIGIENSGFTRTEVQIDEYIWQPFYLDKLPDHVDTNNFTMRLRVVQTSTHPRRMSDWTYISHNDKANGIDNSNNQRNNTDNLGAQGGSVKGTSGYADAASGTTNPTQPVLAHGRRGESGERRSEAESDVDNSHEVNQRAEVENNNQNINEGNTMAANQRIVSTVRGYYESNHAKRTAEKPYRGENWARALLALGEPESSLYTDDQGRNLTPLTSAEAKSKPWVGWKPIAAEIERLENGVELTDAQKAVEASIKEQEEAGTNERIEEILAESRADAKMWPVVDYPNRDAVDLGTPRYWILWYDPKFDEKERWAARGKVWNWTNNSWDTMYQTPFQLYEEHIYDGAIKVKFSDKYEEDRNFSTEGAMILEEWYALMKESPEGKKYIAAQDENNLPSMNHGPAHTQGRSGHGKWRLQHVDDYGYVWDSKSDKDNGEPPLSHVAESAHKHLQERIRALYPQQGE